MPLISPFAYSSFSKVILQRIFLIGCVCGLVNSTQANVADEYQGQFLAELEPERDNLDKVVFQPVAGQKVFPLPSSLPAGANVTAAFLLNPNTEKLEVPALLVEQSGEAPFIWADANLNKTLDADEKFSLQREEAGNPYIWDAVVKISLQKGAYKTFPLFLKFFREVKWDEMGDDDRLILQSSEVFAKGYVDIQGKKTLVAYSYNPRERRITLNRSKIAVDCDGNGEIDWGRFSGEAAYGDDSTVVFRVGNVYVSNKRADVEKNVIVLKSHNANDYNRIELKVGDPFPEFEFKDFKGKKHSLSEYRGKFVLLDFWAIWCGPCRREMPYQKAAYQRYNARGFEILGLNADEPELVPTTKNFLEKNRLEWTQATRESITPLMKALRIHLYPTTLLLDPEGKILSLDERKKGQLELRGKDLLESLQTIFFPAAAKKQPAGRTDNQAAGNRNAASSGGSTTIGNVRLPAAPAGFAWKAAQALKLFCAVPEGWSYQEAATSDGVKIIISEPSATGIRVITDVQKKVEGEAEVEAAALLAKLTRNKQVVGENEQQSGDFTYRLKVLQDGGNLFFHYVVTNSKSNSMRVSMFTCPVQRMDEMGQKAQTVMSMMIWAEN